MIDLTKMRQFRFKDYNDLTNWIRGQAIHSARSAGVPIDEAIAASGALSWATKGGRQFLRTVEGAIQLYLLSLPEELRCDPDEVYKAIKHNPEVEADIWKAHLQLEGYNESVTDKAAADTNPTIPSQESVDS